MENENKYPYKLIRYIAKLYGFQRVTVLDQLDIFKYSCLVGKFGLKIIVDTEKKEVFVWNPNTSKLEKAKMKSVYTLSKNQKDIIRKETRNYIDIMRIVPKNVQVAKRKVIESSKKINDMILSCQNPNSRQNIKIEIGKVIIDEWIDYE